MSLGFSGQSQLASDASVAQIKQEYDQLKTKVGN